MVQSFCAQCCQYVVRIKIIWKILQLFGICFLFWGFFFEIVFLCSSERIFYRYSVANIVGKNYAQNSPWNIRLVNWKMNRGFYSFRNLMIICLFTSAYSVASTTTRNCAKIIISSRSNRVFDWDFFLQFFVSKNWREQFSDMKRINFHYAVLPTYILRKIYRKYFIHTSLKICQFWRMFFIRKPVTKQWIGFLTSIQCCQYSYKKFDDVYCRKKIEKTWYVLFEICTVIKFSEYTWNTFFTKFIQCCQYFVE